MNLAEENAKARALHMTYGQYKAMSYQTPKPAPLKPKTPKPSKKNKTYSQKVAFLLWQEHKSDSQIASALGVSRANIQRWRDILELPPSHKNPIDTKRYRLVETEDGIFAIYE